MALRMSLVNLTSGTHTAGLTPLPGHCHHHPIQTTPSALQSTENPPTQINICTGTATTTSQQNKVSSTPWHIGPKQYHPLRTAWTRNWTTSKQPLNTANSHPGPSTNGITGSTSHNNIPTTPPTTPTTTTQQTNPKTRPP